MNSAQFALSKKTFISVMIVFFCITGIISYKNLGRLEDPTFTIKIALILTPYPGASPQEVADEVTDPLEEAIQSMGQVDTITSTSKEGMSMIFVEMKDTYTSAELPQIWDELRRKVGDAKGELPPGAGPPLVNDDFSDVYGVYYAITGEGYTYAELKEYVQRLKKDLLACENVAKITYWGLQEEAIYIEFDRARIAELGISPEEIFTTLSAQNMVQPSGNVKIGNDYIRITPTGAFEDESVIAELLVGQGDRRVRLTDIAHVSRGYIDPPAHIMRFNGRPAVGLGISTVPGGNVITMGTAVDKALKREANRRPPGIAIHEINMQSKNVTRSVQTFVMNLVQAVIIVVILLMIFMGWQSGLMTGFVLILTILCTFIGMYAWGIELQKISLGALILALGMLVDNAIVVADGILVRVESGETREEAAIEVVKDTQWPLLAATLVSILAFAAIGYSPGNVGEFCRSLFNVMALSLLISWVLAVTVTPLLCVWFLKIPDMHNKDPYDKKMFRTYRRILEACVRMRWGVIVLTILLLITSLFAFRFIPQFFFAESTRPQFYINFWRPQGTHIEEISADMKKCEDFLLSLENIEKVTTFVGEGSLRYVLSYDYQLPNSSFGQFLVEVDDYKKIDATIPIIEKYGRDNFPDAEMFTRKSMNGPSVPFQIEVRFRGPSITQLHSLAEEAVNIMESQSDARSVRTDWRQPVHVIRPLYSVPLARRAGVSRSALAQAFQWTFNGIHVGQYREGDEILPVIARAPAKERETIQSLRDVPVPSLIARTLVPAGQVITGAVQKWEWPLVKRRDRLPCVTVQCNPVAGLADTLLQKLMPEMERIAIPEGYSMEWGGEYEQSVEAQEPLKKVFPMCFVGMFILIVWLFNSIRRPIIIFLCVPLSIIGITAALLLFQLPFGFMSILGFLGLSGMLIKNAVVLIDQIYIDMQKGKQPYIALIDASVSRFRPVLMAAGTTILGMAPLIWDPFYKVMAATIMGGLFAATMLTLILVPVLYSIFFRIQKKR